MGFGRHHRKPKTNRNPLRKIVDHAYGDIDGSFSHTIFEVLECGHRQLPRSDFVGETNAARRRCRQCGRLNVTLKQFRDQHPGIRPNALCMHADGSVLEIISWPYHADEAEQGPVCVKARTPGDATTIETYYLTGPDANICGALATCERDQTKFLPVVNHQGLVDCPTCYRGYARRDDGSWYADRQLTLERTDTTGSAEGG